MSRVRINTINGGEVIAKINEAIDDAAKDIAERDDITAKRVITIKLSLDPKKQFVSLSHQIIKSWPPENPHQSVAFMDGDILVNEIRQTTILDAVKTKQEEANAG